MIFTKNLAPEIIAAIQPYVNALRSPATDLVSFKTPNELIDFCKIVLPKGCVEKVSLDGDELADFREELKETSDIKNADEVLVEKELFQVPNDIFVANTIPLKQLDLELQDTDNGFSDCFKMCINNMVTVLHGTEGAPMNEAFTIEAIIPIDQIQGYITNYPGDVTDLEFVIGAIRYVEKCSTVKNEATALVIMKNDYMYVGDPYFSDISVTNLRTGERLSISEHLADIDGRINNGSLIEYILRLQSSISMSITAFYSVNAALLNPVIVDVYNNKTSRIPDRSVTAKKPSKRGKIRYIKRHFMTVDDVDKAFEKRGFVRKAMIWYVTGHWREYKSGKKVFIQGYWKGALRNMKDTVFKDLEPRERELITKEESDDK